MARLAVSEAFVSKRNELESQRIRSRVDKALFEIAQFPRLGSRIIPLSTRTRFGNGVRKITVAPYQIIYPFDPKADVVYVGDLLYTPSIHGS